MAKWPLSNPVNPDADRQMALEPAGSTDHTLVSIDELIAGLGG